MSYESNNPTVKSGLERWREAQVSKTLEARRANEPMTKMIDRFISDRLGLGEYTEGTARKTRNRLYLFAIALPVPPWEMTKDHVKTWLAGMGEVRPSTKALRYSSVNALFNWAIAEGIVSHNPILLPF